LKKEKRKRKDNSPFLKTPAKAKQKNKTLQEGMDTDN